MKEEATGNAGDAPRDIRDRIPELYQDLCGIAAGMLARHPLPHVSATDVVHEIFLKFQKEEQRRADNGRSRLADKPTALFKACAGAACRDVIADQRRRRRPGETLPETILVGKHDPMPLIVVHDVLEELSRYDPKMARIVECRVFGGMTIPECEAALDIPSRTIDHKWAFARAWLREKLSTSETRA